MAKRKDPIQETGKFILRMVIFALPLIVNQLTDAGLTDWAALATAVLAIADKFQHERGASLKFPI